MFDLYQAPETAAYRQAQLLAEVAADRLARSASEGDHPSTDDRRSPARRVTLFVTDALAALSAAVNAAARRPHWS